MAKTSTDPQSQPGITPNLSTAYWRIQLCCLMFSIVTILPTAAWADSFSIDIGTFCSFCTSGTLNLDHTISDGFFFSGSQTVTTFATTGDLDLDETLMYSKTVSSGSPTDFSFSALGSSLEGTLVFMITGNTNEITFSEIRLVEEDEGPGIMATQMGSLIFTHEEIMPIPEPGTILLFLTGLIGLAGYRWSQCRHKLAQVA